MKKSAHSILTVCMVLVFLITLAACSKRNLDTDAVTATESYEQDEETGSESVTAAPTQASGPEDGTGSEDIADTGATNAPKRGREMKGEQIVSAKSINNGGLYVKYHGYTYYRRYHADSFDATGLWGDYTALVGASKDMMRLKEDGTPEVAFTDDGFGDIYISNNRMYLQRPSDYGTVVYSVNLDGSNRKDLFSGSIQGIDEASDTLVCILINEDYSHELVTVDTATGRVTKLDLANPCSTVLAVRNGFIYYLGEVPYEESVLGKIKLCRVAVDGKQELLLVENDANLYDFETFGAEIPCIQFVDDTIYFSYGGYAGTGYFYQGGLIAQVKTNGRGFQILAGSINPSDASENELVNDSFIVVKEGSRKILYYTGFSLEDDFIRALDLLTGEVTASDFVISPDGIPFEYNSGVSIYQNASSAMTTLLPSIDYSSLGFGNDEYYYRIHDVEQCGDWVYYRLEANEYYPEASIGWRDGYRRIKTQVVREEMGGGKKEILYEY